MVKPRYEAFITEDERWALESVLFGRWWVTLEEDGMPVAGAFARSERAARRRAAKMLPRHLAYKERQRQRAVERASRPTYRVQP